MIGYSALHGAIYRRDRGPSKNDIVAYSATIGDLGAPRLRKDKQKTDEPVVDEKRECDTLEVVQSRTCTD